MKRVLGGSLVVIVAFLSIRAFLSMMANEIKQHFHLDLADQFELDILPRNWQCQYVLFTSVQVFCSASSILPCSYLSFHTCAPAFAPNMHRES